MKKYFLLFALVCVVTVCPLCAQTKADSIAIVQSKWIVKETPEGLVHKSLSIPQLYGGPQHINLVEVPIRPRKSFSVAYSPENVMRRTSDFSTDVNALAAINGTFYNMREGNSVCFLKFDETVADSTVDSEFPLRTNGAIHMHKGKMQIMPWTQEIESAYRRNKGVTIASGPLLLLKGKTCSWDSCERGFIVTKHPRSAIFIKSNKTVVFLTVDGRAPKNAIGMSIPELAHLIRILGGQDAINLDGGGSTTLWLKDAPYDGVINCPSDNRTFDHLGERNVSNIIYVR